MKRLFFLLLYLGFALALFLAGLKTMPAPSTRSVNITPSSSPAPVTGSTGELIKVKRVVDGDTIQIETGQSVRYIGINTPETKHPVKKTECFGKEASLKNSELVEGKFVRLEKDVSETDRYGRLLRFVWVYDTKEATGEAVFVNEELVRQGYAQVSTYPPDVKYADLFRKAQEEAMQNGRGLWSACR